MIYRYGDEDHMVPDYPEWTESPHFIKMLILTASMTVFEGEIHHIYVRFDQRHVVLSLIELVDAPNEHTFSHWVVSGELAVDSSGMSVEQLFEWVKTDLPAALVLGVL